MRDLGVCGLRFAEHFLSEGESGLYGKDGIRHLPSFRHVLLALFFKMSVLPTANPL